MSSSSYSLWRDVVPPSAVEHSVSAELGVLSVMRPALAAQYLRSQLVLAKNGGLEVYCVSSTDQSMPLVLTHKIPLHGNPESLCTMRPPGWEVDLLLVSFADAKVSALRYSPEQDLFLTTSLFNLDTAHVHDGRDTYHFHPTLAVDPKQRCAAMLVSSSILSVFPVDSLAGKPNVSSTSAFSGNLDDLSFTKDLQDMGISRIIDLVFLHGYLEPTLLLLHEPYHSWDGRFAARRNTCQLVAFSLDLTRQQVSLICSSELLPLHTHRLLACPAPLGGALVFSPNLIFHFSQTIDFALSLNEFGDLHEHDFRVDLVPSPLLTSLQVSSAVFLSSSQILVSSSQQVFLLSLSLSGDSLLSMVVAKTSIQETCSSLTFLPGLLFVGSRIGAPLLLRVQSTEKEGAEAEETMEVDPVESGEGSASRELETLLFGAPLQVSKKAVQPSNLQEFQFHKLFEFVNFGPISFFALSPSFLDDSGEKTPELTKTYTDVVLSSGLAQNSALFVTNDGIRPLILGSFDFEKAVRGCWTLRTEESKEFDSFVLVSFEDSSLVLSSLHGLEQVSQEALETSKTTLAAQNLDENRFMVQVHQAGVCLVSSADLQRVQDLGPKELKVKGDVHIVQAVVMDPFVLILLEDGTLRLLTFSPKKKVLSCSVPKFTWPSPQQGQQQIVCFSLFQDQGSGFFEPLPLQSMEVDEEETEAPEDEEQESRSSPLVNLEDYLFGEERQRKKAKTRKKKAPAKTPTLPKSYSSCPLALLCRDDGSLGIFALPSLELLFFTSQVPAGLPLLSNLLSDSPQDAFEEFAVEELRMVSFGPASDTFLVLLLTTGDLLLYKCLWRQRAGLVPLEFRKVDHSLILRTSSVQQKLCQRIHSFSNISGLSGIYVSGNRPSWFLHLRGSLFEHYQAVRGDSLDVGRGSFVAFNSESCNDGFISFFKGSLQICQLPDPDSVRLDHSFPCRKVPIGKTARQICYHRQSDTFTVVVSEKVETDSFDEVSERSLPVYKEKFELQLFTSSTFNFAEVYADVAANEVILTLESCQVWDMTKNKFTEFIAIGTSIYEGEENLCRGRVILFEIYDATPSDLSGAGLTYKKVYDQTERASVTQIKELMGALCISVGARVIIYRWGQGKLTGCAFFDSQLYPASLSTLKHFVLLGDVWKGACLVYWEPAMKHLLFLGKDFDADELYATTLLPDGRSLKVVTSDAYSNIRVLSYAPQHPSSRGGEKLLSVEDFHVGSRITQFERLQRRGMSSLGAAGEIADARHRDTPSFMALGCSVSGSMGYLVCLDEMLYRRLYSLHAQMTYRVHHPAGLNPKLFRTYQTSDKRKYEVHGNIVDGNFLWEFRNLDYFSQRTLARNLGTTPDNVLQNLLDLDISTRFF